MTSNREIPINPKLPTDFDGTPNDDRPASHMRWWGRPYIQTFTADDLGFSDKALLTKWFAAWPTGTRYDVRCLDGGAWDRPTCLGMFGSLDAALSCAVSACVETYGAPA